MLARCARSRTSAPSWRSCPGTDGLLHISEVADHHVKDVREYVNEGDELLVKVVNIDDRDRIRLSLKAVTEEDEAKMAARR